MNRTIFLLGLAACCLGSKNKRRKYRARITYYHPYQNKWGSRVACPNTKRAQYGVTCAAHPDFKFGEKIFIPELKGIVGDGYFIVQDRGAAVTKKKASKGTHYVFDIFVKDQLELNLLSKNQSQYMEVYV